MYVHMSEVAEPLAQPSLYVCGVLMGSIQRELPRHAYVHFYGIQASDAPRAQMVNAAHVGLVGSYAYNLVLDVLGQALLEQLTGGVAHQSVGRAYDEQAHDGGSYRVEHRPLLTQNDCSADTYCGTYRREGVAAVVPCVGNEHLRVELAARLDGHPERYFLHDNAHHCCHKRYDARTFYDFAVEEIDHCRHSLDADHGTGGKQHGADDGSGECLILAATVVMAIILRLAQLYKNEHHNVGQEIGKRVCGVCYHGSRSAHDSGNKLEHEQHHVGQAAKQCHLINLMLTLICFHNSVIINGCKFKYFNS